MSRAGRRTLLVLALVAVGMSAPAAASPDKPAHNGAHRSTQSKPAASANHKCWTESSADPLGGLLAANPDCDRLLGLAKQMIDFSLHKPDAADEQAMALYNRDLADLVAALDETENFQTPQGQTTSQHLKTRVVRLQPRLGNGRGPNPASHELQEKETGAKKAPIARWGLSDDNLAVIALIAALFALALSALTMTMEFFKRNEERIHAGQLRQLDQDVATEKAAWRKDLDYVSQVQQQLRDSVEALTAGQARCQPAAPASQATHKDSGPPIPPSSIKQWMSDPGPDYDASYDPYDFDHSAALSPQALLPATQASDGFLGTVSDLLRRTPAGSRTMRYDNAAKLLIDGPAVDFGYTVFADPRTSAMRVLPCLQRASLRTELFGFEPLFDLEGTGPGSLSVIQHPDLEPIGTAFRVVGKGRLRIG